MPQLGFVCHCLQDQTQDLYPQVDSAVRMLGLSSAVGYIHLILTGDVQLDHLSWGSQLLHRKVTTFSQAKTKQFVREQLKMMQLSRSLSRFLLDLASGNDSFLNQYLLWWMIILFCILNIYSYFEKLSAYLNSNNLNINL